MQRPALMRLALGVAMLLAVLAPTACGGGGSARGGEAAQEGKANEAHRIPEDSQTYEGELLPAGRYETDEFEPAMSLSLGEGWTRGGAELRDIWDVRPVENDENWVGFGNIEGVYEPDGSGGLAPAPAPEDMAAWLRSNPYLKTGKPEPASVGGEEGVTFDAVVSDAPESPVCAGRNDLGLFQLSDGGPTPSKGERSSAS